MRNHLMDRHKQWIMKGWHAMCFRDRLLTPLPTKKMTTNSPFVPKQHPVRYKTIRVNELDIFYREAGPQTAPTILLLHGFPTSSNMFRNLIPRLATSFHVVAPDYPGFGQSSMPSHNDFDYSFENLTPTLIVWGKNDFIFPPEGAAPYPRDLRDVETHLLDTGHFALETHGEEIASRIEEFLRQHKLAV